MCGVRCAVVVFLHPNTHYALLLPSTRYMKWTNRVLQEFWNQGDAERAAGLPVSKGFDRVEAAKPGALAASQAGFMQFIVADVYVNFDKVPGVDLAEPLEYMNEVSVNISAISALAVDPHQW